jgi:ParB family chromosome partitioning protein
MKNQFKKPIRDIDIDMINPSPDNVREEYDNLKELADSIEQVDLINPILVTPDPIDNQFAKRTYTIISGHRRYFAIKKYLSHWDKIKSTVINEVDYHRVKQIQLIENIQREELTDYDIALGLSELWDTGLYATKKELAQSVGKKQSYLSKAFNVVENLGEEIKEQLQQAKPNIGLSKLDEIARIKDHDTQKEVMQKVEAGELKRDDIKDYAQSKKDDDISKDHSEYIRAIKSEYKESLKQNDIQENEVQTHLEDFLQDQDPTPQPDHNTFKEESKISPVKIEDNQLDLDERFKTFIIDGVKMRGLQQWYPEFDLPTFVTSKRKYKITIELIEY